jgi:hypothetical protein
LYRFWKMHRAGSNSSAAFEHHLHIIECCVIYVSVLNTLS